MRVPILLLTSMLAAAAQAQIRLPSLALPNTSLPNTSLPGTSLLNAPQALDESSQGALADLRYARRIAMRRLIRDNRRTIDTDPDGQPIVRSEILAVAISDEALARARSLGFVLEREQALAAANLRVLVLRSPAALSTPKALRQLRAADPGGVYDYDHIYAAADSVATDRSPQGSTPPAATRLDAPPRMRVGMLDSGIDASHPAFHDSLLHTWGCADRRIADAHGTAVASILVAHASAELFAADVYCGAATGGAVEAIVAALDWLAQQHVAVINVSLVGPKNALLERAVSALVARGELIVAAVGNDGPAAPPLYPAAYPDVVGVTAVDARRHVLIEAERGPQVTFAARGADLEAANLEHGFGRVRGTSFAAPTVAALLAGVVALPDPSAAQAAVAALARQAIDLGPPGKDLTYGFGLVGTPE